MVILRYNHLSALIWTCKIQPQNDAIDLDGIERIAPELLGLGIAVVPLMGLALNYTPFGIRLVPILVVLSAFTVSLAVIAGVRRLGLPAGERFVARVGASSEDF